MMTVAVRCGQTSVVRWLFDQSIYPAYQHFKQAFGYQRSEIVQMFLDTKILSLNRSASSVEILALAV